MNDDEIGQQKALAALRQGLALPPEELSKLLADRKRLTERVEEMNNRAVGLIGAERWQQALVYLEAAEHLLQSAAVRGHLTDRCLVQCILHNEASCYQNLWQLDQCSNYIEALIFNLNSRRDSVPPPAHRQGKLPLAHYYLHFCAVNSQLGNHSGALISARKSLQLVRGEMREWKRMLEGRRGKSEEERTRLLGLVCRFNDSINMSLSETVGEAVSYYLRSWRVSISSNKSVPREAREVIESFNMKAVMALGSLTLSDCIIRNQKQPQMGLADIFQRILLLATCYFTIATELRLISLKKSRDNNLEKTEQPEYKQSQIYHLLSILLLALTLPLQSPFMGHLLHSFQNHYPNTLLDKDVPFRKAFPDILFSKQEKILREPSIEVSEHQEALVSHLSKGSGTIIRKTKQSERGNKLSLIETKSKKSKMKITETKHSKSKKDVHFISKGKHPRQSLSKSPYVRTASKESILIRPQKSKESLQKSPIPSIKLITNPSKAKISHQIAKSSEREKAVSKTKRKAKMEQNGGQYFLLKKGEQKKPKKTSFSSKKNSHPRSTGRLPIDSTLEGKDQLVREKKSSKKSILQHYL